MEESIQFINEKGENVYPNPNMPIGSIYLSVNDTNPSAFFGGKWEQIAQGRTLVGVDTSQTEFNTVKKTGGEKTHILTVNEMPQHKHYNTRWGGDVGAWAVMGSNGTGTGSDYDNQTGLSGGNQPHNNLQPYFTCYIWCRVA